MDTIDHFSLRPLGCNRECQNLRHGMTIIQHWITTDPIASLVPRVYRGSSAWPSTPLPSIAPSSIQLGNCRRLDAPAGAPARGASRPLFPPIALRRIDRAARFGRFALIRDVATKPSLISRSPPRSWQNPPALPQSSFANGIIDDALVQCTCRSECVGGMCEPSVDHSTDGAGHHLGPLVPP
jgi:hypothetical protein